MFWNLLDEVDSIYILCQRIIWSAVFAGVVLLCAGRGKEILKVLKSGRTMLICLAAGILVSVNWGVYIYAVNSGHILDASLGYFVEPLMVGVIGVVFFREKLSGYEKLAYVCAAAGLLYMIAVSRVFPALSLVISISFALYGAVKKLLNAPPMLSLFTETLCVLPVALIYAGIAEAGNNGAAGVLSGAQYLLLPLCGVVTSVPLFLFNRGVKLIPYYIVGILMYVNPTIQFFMGLLYYKEPLDMNRLIAFAFIWIGIGIAIWGNVQMLRKTAEK